MLSSKTKRELKIDQRQILIDSIEIGIPSTEQILTWGERTLPNGKKVGLVKSSKTVNYKRFTPFRDGLFCERIFGPVTSFVCACGKKQPHSKITFCEKCEVEYIDQRSRRYRLGYISLLSPVTHIWYLKGRPSYLSLFLGKRKKTIVALAYCNAYLIEHGISKKDHNEKTSHMWPSMTSFSNTENFLQNVKKKVSIFVPSLGHEQSNRGKVKNFKNVIPRNVLSCKDVSVKDDILLKKKISFFSKCARNTKLSRCLAVTQRGKKANDLRLHVPIYGKDLFSICSSSTRVLPSFPVLPKTKNNTSRNKNQLNLNGFKGSCPYTCQSTPFTSCARGARQSTPFTSCARGARQSTIGKVRVLGVLPLLTPTCPYLPLLAPTGHGTARHGTAGDFATKIGKGRATPLFAPKGHGTSCKVRANKKQTGSSATKNLNFPSLVVKTPNQIGLSACRACSYLPFMAPSYKAKLWTHSKKEHWAKKKQEEARRRVLQGPSLPLLGTAKRGTPCQSTIGKVDWHMKKQEKSQQKKSKELYLSTSYGTYSYIRQHTLPFLPSLISHFYLRDALLNFTYSLAAHDDVPLIEYCRIKRWEPLRDVHKFMAHQTVAQKDKWFRHEENDLSAFTHSFKNGLNKKNDVKKLRRYKTYLNTSSFFTNQKTSLSKMSNSRFLKKSFNGQKNLNNNFIPFLQSFKLQDRKPNLLIQELNNRGSSLSDLELNAIREILSYTGGGALQQLLQQFDPHDLCKFLFAEIQILRVIYETNFSNFSNSWWQSQQFPFAASGLFLRCLAPEAQSKKGQDTARHEFQNLSKTNLIQKSNIETQPTRYKTNFPVVSLQNRIFDNFQASRSFVSNICNIKIRKIFSKSKTFVQPFLVLPHFPQKDDRSVLFTKLNSSSKKNLVGFSSSFKKRKTQFQIVKNFFPYKSKGGVSKKLGFKKLRFLAFKEPNSVTLALNLTLSPKGANLFFASKGTLGRWLHQASANPKQVSLPLRIPTLSGTKSCARTFLTLRDRINRNRESNSLVTKKTKKIYTNVLQTFLRAIAPMFLTPKKSNIFISRKIKKQYKDRNEFFTSLQVTNTSKKKHLIFFEKGKYSTTSNNSQNKFPELQKKQIIRISKRIYKIARRLKVAQLLTRNHRRPEWMILSHLPVLPPDLRPILQMSEKVIVASDLNIMYQRVIYRNNRHLRVRFIDFHLVTAIQRLVQDAVDRLIENGKGGSKPYYTQGGRPLKSLSDILKGKKGRFRLNLLGKRVDFSGRSVIVVSPSCKIHECGLPKNIALELYHYFLLRQLIVKKHCASIVTAKKMIKLKSPLMWDILRELMYHHPVLLNRAPTLHRLGIQAFQPKLVLGNAILLHPLVCSGFNADFDGDQMGVHLPLSFAARAESWDLLWSRNNLLSPATGQPMLVPSQDMVLGFYYITAPPFRKMKRSNSIYRKMSFFINTQEISTAFQKGKIQLHQPVWVEVNSKVEDEAFSQMPLELRVQSFGKEQLIYKNSIYNNFFIKDKNENRKKGSFHFSFGKETSYCNRVLGLPFSSSVNENGKVSFEQFSKSKSNSYKIPFFICTKPISHCVRTTAGRILMNNLLNT